MELKEIEAGRRKRIKGQIRERGRSIGVRRRRQHTESKGGRSWEAETQAGAVISILFNRTFLEQKNARREERNYLNSEYRKQTREQHLANVEKEFEIACTNCS